MLASAHPAVRRHTAPMWSRREVLELGAVGTLAALARPALAKDAVKLITRPIPSTGEHLPAIGIGSYQTFDVKDAKTVAPVLAKFLSLGGRVVDSSPMYGRAEAAIGEMLAALHKQQPDAAPWLATKVWTTGKREGVAQMKKSLERLGVQARADADPQPGRLEDAARDAARVERALERGERRRLVRGTRALPWACDTTRHAARSDPRVAGRATSDGDSAPRDRRAGSARASCAPRRDASAHRRRSTQVAHAARAPRSVRGTAARDRARQLLRVRPLLRGVVSARLPPEPLA